MRTAWHRPQKQWRGVGCEHRGIPWSCGLRVSEPALLLGVQGLVSSAGSHVGVDARYRDLVGQFERAKKVEEQQVDDLIQCIECPEDNKKVAVLYCDVCQDMFCQVRKCCGSRTRHGSQTLCDCL